MSELMVLGERCTDIADELAGMDMRFLPNGMARCTARMRADGPLVRALYRAEAELLLADATDMADGRYVGRTPEQRRADAFLELVSRFTKAFSRTR
jgi:hypothetical protein